MFTTLEEIKEHCDKVFPDTIPLKVESLILSPQTGERSYQIKIYLMAPDAPEIVQPLRARLDEIKKHIDASRYRAETQYGKVRPVGYHFELNVRTLKKDK